MPTIISWMTGQTRGDFSLRETVRVENGQFVTSGSREIEILFILTMGNT